MSAEKSADRGASEGAGREKQKSGHFSHWKKLFTKAPMTRRDFLKTARDWGILAAGVEVLNDGPKLKPRLKEEINEALFGDELEKSIEAKIKFIKSEYGIEVEMGPQAAGCINMRKGGEDIRGNELSPDRKNKVLDGLIEAMEVYPYWFLWQSINMIFAVGELLDKETEQGAFILGGKTLGEENIVLGFGVAGKNSAEKIRNFLRLGDDVKSLKGCFHHEFFHLFDHFGGIGGDFWNGLNPKGKKAYLGNGWRNLKERPSGFVREYGAKNPREDRATIFQMVASQPGRISAICSDDPIVKEKLAVIKEYIFLVSFGLMDEKYWDILASGELGNLSGLQTKWGREDLEGMSLKEKTGFLKKQGAREEVIAVVLNAGIFGDVMQTTRTRTN